MWEGHRTICRSQIPPSTMYVLEIEVKYLFPQAILLSSILVFKVRVYMVQAGLKLIHCVVDTNLELLTLCLYLSSARNTSKDTVTSPNSQPPIVFLLCESTTVSLDKSISAMKTPYRLSCLLHDLIFTGSLL